jgi:hypothetical protein
VRALPKLELQDEELQVTEQEQVQDQDVDPLEDEADRQQEEVLVQEEEEEEEEMVEVVEPDLRLQQTEEKLVVTLWMLHALCRALVSCVARCVSTCCALLDE